MDIKQKFIKFNNPNRPLEPMGIVIHNTDNPNDSAEMEYNYFNSGDRSASAHAFIDSKEIIQTIPWYKQAWHAGATANSAYIGLEMCTATTPEAFEVIWNQTIELTAILFITVLKQKTVTNDNLMSHAEVSKKWNESTHMDPISYFSQFGKTFDAFRQAVQNKLEAIETITSVVDAVDFLSAIKLIDTPDYWLKASQCVKNLDILLIKCANKLKG